LFITWHNRTGKLDKDCALYDRKAEKTMRPLLDEFVGWLSSGEYDDEEAYGEEEGETEAADGEEEKKELVETEDQKKQRMLIEAQKRAQDELAVQAKAAATLKKEQDEKKA